MTTPSELLVPTTIGIRHLSPAAAVHLEAILDRVSPEAVVIESPAGCEAEMRHLVHPDTVPPVALLAFTSERPVRTFVLPFAVYSPEWVACRWAIANGRELVFMDLPADVFLAFERDEVSIEPEAAEEEDEATGDAPARSPLERLALAAGAPDLETFWERTFEHTTDPRAYVETAFAVGEGLRALDASPPARVRETELREAHMRRTIEGVLARHPKEKVVVVCGAFHAPVLTGEQPAMSGDELAALPRADTVVTLMPYSHARLHERSGYGAGNHAPRYFEALYRELAAGHPDRLATRFLSEVCHTMRTHGVVRSSAQVIDAVRLSQALAAIADSPAVTLRDLRDAAYTCLGAGETLPVTEALEAIETGVAVGRLPDGVSRTALQDDFRREMSRLSLDRYVREEPTPLELDLRENRWVKNEAAARLDAERSIFFRRLVAVDIPLVTEDESRRQDKASWKERWIVQWAPAVELELAERSLVGDSVAGATSYVLSERLARSRGAGDAAEVLASAALCRLADALEAARARVQEAAVEDDDLGSIARAVTWLLDVVRYGGLRAVDPEPLWPLVAQLFLRGSLLVPSAVACDDAALGGIRSGLVALATAAAQAPDRLPVDELESSLRQVALGDRGHAHLVGVCTALLLERGALTDGELTGCVGRRLMPGTEPDAAAGFFEGLCAHNRMALFARRAVWESLTRFVDALDGEGLLRAVAPLRRAFSAFSPGELRRVVSALGETWGTTPSALARAIEKPIADEALDELGKKLGDLGDLDL